MKLKNILLGLVLVGLLMVPMIYAQSEEFKIFSLMELNVCSCSTQSNTIVIENTANIRNSYAIFSNSPFVSFDTDTFTLNPKEKISIVEKIEIPCDTKDMLDILISVRNNRNYQKAFTQEVSSGICSNLVVQPLKTDFSGKPCETYTAEFNIFNPGPFAEGYDIELVDFSGELKFNKEIEIPSKKFQKIETEIVPECSLSGEFGASIDITSRNTKLLAKIPLSFSIEKDYEYEISSEEKVDICLEEGRWISVKLTNNAGFSNSYSLEINSEAFRLSEEKVEIGPGEDATVFLQPSLEGLEPQEGKLELDVISEYGEYEKSLSIDYVISGCYSYEMMLEQDKICQDDHDIKLKINYQGTKESELNLFLEGDEAFSLDDESVSLNYGDEKSITIKIDGDELTEGPKTLSFTSNIERKNITHSENLQLSVLSIEDCYRPVLSGKTYVKRIGDKYRQKYIEIKNIGIKETEYDLSMESIWVNLQQAHLTLKPQESKVFPVETWAENLESKGTYPVEFKVKAMEGQEYVKSIDFVVYEYSLTDFIFEFKCFIGAGIIVLLIIAFSILAYLNRDSKKKKLGFVSLLFLAVFFLFLNLNWCFGNYQSFYGWDYKEKIIASDYECQKFLDEEICNSQFYIRWEEDTIKEINMEDYFYDPDANILTYSLEKESENVSVGFSQNKAKLIPKKDWYGTEEMYFTVSDGSEFTAKSPKFYLQVVNTKEFYFSDFFLENHKRILMTLMIVSIILLFFFFVRFLDIREDQGERVSSEEKELEKKKIKKIKKLD